MKKKIEIEAGEGRSNFHNVGNISVVVDTGKIIIWEGDQYYIISTSQARRLDKRFCGISDCVCGCSPVLEYDQDRYAIKI
jgi:hypothetical protein